MNNPGFWLISLEKAKQKLNLNDTKLKTIQEVCYKIALASEYCSLFEGEKFNNIYNVFNPKADKDVCFNIQDSLMMLKNE